VSAAATGGIIAGDRGARFSGSAPAEVRSSRLRAGIAASSLLAHGCLVLTFVFFDPAANPSGREREIPVEITTEPLVPGTSAAPSSGSEKPFGLRDAAQAPPATPSQKPDIDPNPKPANEAMSGPNPVAKPAAPAPAEPERKAIAIVHKEIAHEYRTAAKPAGSPARRGGERKNQLPTQTGSALPFDSGPDSFRAVAVPLPAATGGEATSYSFIVGGMLERVKHYPETARQRAAKGIAIIGFVLDELGRITSVSLLRSSSEADLDAESVALVRRAAPFPLPPSGAQHSFAIEVAFGMGS
jgi:periplasmic protein TonB